MATNRFRTARRILAAVWAAWALACAGAPAGRVWTADELFDPANLGKTATAEGVVFAVDTLPIDGSARVMAHTLTATFRLIVQDPGNLYDLVGARVRATGTLAPVTSPRGYVASVEVRVPSAAGIEVVEPSVADPFALPVTDIGRLRTPEDRESPLGWKHVRGYVTMYWPGASWCFIRQENGHVSRVELRNSGRGGTLSIGDEIDVVGFIRPYVTAPLIEYSRILLTGRRKELETAADLTPGTFKARFGVSGAENVQGQRVRVTGTVRDLVLRDTVMELVLSDGGETMCCSLRHPMRDRLPDGFGVGAVVRVTGVAAGRYEYRPLPQDRVRIDPMVLYAGGIRDVELLEGPPWWTAPRLRVVNVCVGGFALLAVWFVVWFARTARRQTARLAESQRSRLRDKVSADAVRRERLRLSSDLHDDFQQYLAGAKFQLGAANALLAAGAPAEKVREQIDQSIVSINHTQNQLRVVLWGLTEESEGSARLAELFRYAVGRIAGWRERVEFETHGEEPTFARDTAGALLMILQEAVGNALRHGGGGRVRVSLDFARGSLTMRVSDTGPGFDVAAAARPGHYGLGTMRERAAFLGGTCEIVSAPGQGATVIVRVPCPGGTDEKRKGKA